MNSKKTRNLISENNKQSNDLVRSIEILAEMTRENIERSRAYFDVSPKLELSKQIDN